MYWKYDTKCDDNHFSNQYLIILLLIVHYLCCVSSRDRILSHSSLCNKTVFHFKLFTYTHICGRVSVGILCTQSENQLSTLTTESTHYKVVAFWDTFPTFAGAKGWCSREVYCLFNTNICLSQLMLVSSVRDRQCK